MERLTGVTAGLQYRCWTAMERLRVFVTEIARQVPLRQLRERHPGDFRVSTPQGYQVDARVGRQRVRRRAQERGNAVECQDGTEEDVVWSCARRDLGIDYL